MRQPLTLEQIRQAPKVLLHDHLDGGLRPSTVIELARETGYDDLPTTDEAELAAWFTAGAARQDLVLYLETFAHTVGVRSEEHTSELQSLMRSSSAVFCLKKKKTLQY